MNQASNDQLKETQQSAIRLAKDNIIRVQSGLVIDELESQIEATEVSDV